MHIKFCELKTEEVSLDCQEVDLRCCMLENIVIEVKDDIRSLREASKGQHETLSELSTKVYSTITLISIVESELDKLQAQLSQQEVVTGE